MSTPQKAITLRGVRKVYGRGDLAFEALADIDLDVAAGEFMMIMGPSGSGKTTLLSIIGCILRPSAGRVELLGEPVSQRSEQELPDLRRELIGFVFQAYNLLSALSVLENVAVMLQMRGWPVVEARTEARRLLQSVGLDRRLERKPRDVSGGQRQRVAIARAIAGSPPIVLADELTANLDAENGQQVTELLRRLAKDNGHTVIIVTHDNRIVHLADRIVTIEDGRIGSDTALLT